MVSGSSTHEVRHYHLYLYLYLFDVTYQKRKTKKLYGGTTPYKLHILQHVYIKYVKLKPLFEYGYIGSGVRHGIRISSGDFQGDRKEKKK